MIVVNIVNLILETLKFGYNMAYAVGRQLSLMTQMPDDANKQQIETVHMIQAHAGLFKGISYGIAIGLFLFQIIYSISALMIMKRTDVKAALAKTIDPPVQPMM